MSAFSVGQLSAQPPSLLPSETAIKEYLMWMQRLRERLRGQKECYITVALKASGCYFMPTVTTISIQNIQMHSHTCNPGRGERARKRKRARNLQ